MYNIGGFQSSHSVVWRILGYNAPFVWKSMNLANYDFTVYWAKEAFVVENKIVYFGRHNKKETLVLDNGGESEQL